jgi:hypothetical protein
MSYGVWTTVTVSRHVAQTILSIDISEKLYQCQTQGDTSKVHGLLDT